MIANILILLFIAGMAYWHGLQGLFSAFLHLVLTIAAIALSLALWEPVAHLLLGTGTFATPMAWGLSLLALLVVWLVVLRVAMDKLVSANMEVSSLVNMIAGGFCGALSAVFTAGIVVIGLGFLPLGVDLGGYQPLRVGGDGKIVGQVGDGLLLPVDRLTSSVFTGLSNGAFSSRRPMDLYLPEVARQAVLFRLRYDANASLVARPDSVEVPAVFVINRPRREAGADPAATVPFFKDAERLAVIETKWTTMPGTFDLDSTLRLPPTQVRLVSWITRAGRPEAHLHAPLAVFNRQFRPAGQPEAYIATRFDDDRSSAYALRDGEVLRFVFPLPVDHEPKFLLVRRLRLTLPEPSRGDVGPVLAMLAGAAAPPVTTDTTPPTSDPTQGTIGPREGTVAGAAGIALELSSSLPKPISMNAARNLTFTNREIMVGNDDVRQTSGIIAREVISERFQVPGHQAMVRLELARDQAHTWWGQTLASASMINSIFLRDDAGQRTEPSGYVWLRQDGSQRIVMDRTTPIRSGRQLPITDMGPGDRLFLYFIVPRGVRIVSLDLGSRTLQQANLVVPQP